MDDTILVLLALGMLVAAFVFGIFLSRAVAAARGGGSGGGATGEW